MSRLTGRLRACVRKFGGADWASAMDRHFDHIRPVLTTAGRERSSFQIGDTQMIDKRRPILIIGVPWGLGAPQSRTVEPEM